MPEVCQFNPKFIVDQNISEFNVSVSDTLVIDILYSSQKMPKERLADGEGEMTFHYKINQISS